MNMMEKALYSALYDVMSDAWHKVEAEAQARNDAASTTETTLELREAA